jgi:predicted O-methyltransferase YrrM
MSERSDLRNQKRRNRFDSLLVGTDYSIPPDAIPDVRLPQEKPIVRTPAAGPPVLSSVSLFKLGSQVTRQYADKALEILTGGKPVVPWMKWREIAIIQEILTRLRPKKCLEWGAGYSTAYFPRFIPADSEWISIEHDESWFTAIQLLNKNPNVRLTHIPPDRYPFRDLYGDGTRDDLKTYIDYPMRERFFDFVLVDGRARMECVARAAKILDPQGVMIMHDANREMYARGSAAFRHQALFKDHRTDHGGLWICSIGRSLDSVFDIARHGQVWSLYASIGKSSVGRMLRV